MKKYINQFILLMFGLLIVQSCSEDDKVVDEVFATVTRGATLKTINVISGVVDIFNIETSVFEVELEYRDNEDGALLGSFDVYARFTDNTDDGTDNSAPEVFLFNVAGSAFAVDPTFGNPRTTLTIPASTTLTALGLSDDQLNGGDNIIYRLVLKLTDGREFSDEASGNITGGSFFSSPFAYTAPLVCLFDEPGFFSGSYLMEQISGADPFFNSQTFGGDQIVDVVAAGINRKILFNYFPGTFDLVGTTLNLDLICGDILVSSDLTGGSLSCADAPIAFAQGLVTATFDVNFVDDDVFEIQIADFTPDGDCGTGPNQIVIRLTKQ